MKTLTTPERLAWCEGHGLHLSDSAVLDFKRSVAMDVPRETRRMLDLVTELFRDEQEFPGGLFWIDDLGSRRDEVCDVGLAIFSSMCGLEPGEMARRPLQDFSILFGADERLSAEAFIFHGFSFGWGGYFVPDHAQYYLFINPDGVFDAFTESQKWIQLFSEFPEMLGIRESGRWVSRKPKL